jgi:hypothetical protein
MDELTLEQYLASERDRLEKFEAFWKLHQKHRPSEFPVTLPYGDWEEQFEFFES